MGVRLKNPNGPYPPQGYIFSDPHTAMQFTDEGIDLHSQALKVIEHRKANPNIYKESDAIRFDVEEVKKEIVIQVCSRQPSYCEDESRPGVPYPAPPEPAQHEIHRQQGKTCVKCGGSEFTAIMCRTCGGSRVQSYKCNKCGFDN